MRVDINTPFSRPRHTPEPRVEVHGNTWPDSDQRQKETLAH